MNRVFITAFSSISSVGVGIDESIDNLRSGFQNIVIPKKDDKLFKPYFKIQKPLEIKKYNTRCSQISLQLLKIIENKFIDYSSLPVFLSTSTGGIKETEENFINLLNKSSNYSIFKNHFFNCISDAIKEKYKDKIGKIYTFTTACSSSGHSIMQAYRLLKNNIIDKAIIVGVDCLSQTTMYGFDSLKLVSEKGARPLTIDRDGLSLGEGGGILLLESSPSTEPLGEICGASTNSDGYHISSPDPAGIQQNKCIYNALNDAGIKPGDIEYISAHGTGTQINDKVEMEVIKSIFPVKTIVTSLKAFIGHTLGASAIAEVALTFGMLMKDKIFQVKNIGEPIDKDYIPLKTTHKKVNYFLKNSFGFGGNNVTLIFKNLLNSKIF